MKPAPGDDDAPVPRPLVWRKTVGGTNAMRVARAGFPVLAMLSVLYLLAALLLAPRHKPTRVVLLPEQAAKQLVQPPEIPLPLPPPLTAASRAPVVVRQVADRPEDQDLQPATPALPTPLRQRGPALDPEVGREGRRRAETATAQLAGAAAALEGALGGLSTTLGSLGSDAGEPAGGRRGRDVGAGRDDAKLTGYSARTPAVGSADLERSGVKGSRVAVGTLVPTAAPAAEAGSPEASEGRSTASLLAVVDRHAAGIRFCYENELNRQPGLRGKLVVALTVAASGKVVDARVVQNTLAVERVATCALAQICAWEFAAVPDGVTSFQIPFIFAPPN